MFVEIFSGTGRLGQAAAHEGLQVLWRGISFGQKYDLTLGKNQNLLLGWLSSACSSGSTSTFPARHSLEIAIAAVGRPR